MDAELLLLLCLLSSSYTVHCLSALIIFIQIPLYVIFMYALLMLPMALFQPSRRLSGAPVLQRTGNHKWAVQ